MRQARLQAEAEPQPQGIHQTPRQPGAEGSDHGPPGRRQHRPGRGHDAEVRALRPLPHAGRSVCTRAQFAASQCPAGSIYGYARAVTPLLDDPIEGPVYLRSSNSSLPDLVADLNGQLRVALAARIDTTKGGGIRASFENVPDVPLSELVVELAGGKKGLLENSANLCAGADRASVLLGGQNGKSAVQSPVLANGCKKARKARKGAKKRSGRRAGR